MDLIQSNYDQSEYTFQCFRKHTFKDSNYHVYVLPDTLILSAVRQSGLLRYYPLVAQIQEPQHIIFWSVSSDKRLEAFGFIYNKETKYFFSPQKDLEYFRQLLSNRVMFRDISDFYIPTKLLGKGASSKVYLVGDKLNKQKQFASKCIDKNYLMEDGGFDALYLEIQNMRDLQHQNIISLRETYEGENTFYMILEVLEGDSLHQFLNRGDQLQFSEIKLILKQIVQGVAYIHKKQLIHRDLKPENIMFKKKDDLTSLKIVDFGLATSETVSEYPFPKCGTPGYVAPEVANLKDMTYKYSKICDMFSVGCIFYKLITKKDLFPGQDYENILKMNKKCNINLSNLSIFKTPHDAQDLIRRMLEPDPFKRISAEEALKHEFLKQDEEEGYSPSLKKQKYQKQKNEKKAQTQCFAINEQQQVNNQLNLLKYNDDCDLVDDEFHASLEVPVQMIKKKPSLDQFVMKSTLRKKNMNQQQTAPPRHIKKSPSIDLICENEKNIRSPVSALTVNHPSLVMQNSEQMIRMDESSIAYSPALQTPNSIMSPGCLRVRISDQSKKQMSQQIIQENVEDEEKHDSTKHQKK